MQITQEEVSLLTCLAETHAEKFMLSGKYVKSTYGRFMRYVAARFD
jgi:hypothetical protein